MTIRINSIQSVMVDGVDVGSLATADSMLTFEELQEAVVEWHDRVKGEAVAAIQLELGAEIDRLHTSISELGESSLIVISRLETENTKLKQDLQATRKVVAAFMESTADGKEIKKLYKQILLESQIEKWQNELNSLDQE